MEVSNSIGSKDLEGHFCKVRLTRCGAMVDRSNSSSISGAGMIWETQSGSPGMYVTSFLE